MNARAMRMAGRRAVWLLGAMGATLGAQEGKRNVLDRPDLQGEWYRRERAYPFDSIPAGAHARAMLSVRGERGTPAMRSMSGAATTTTVGWRSVGPSPIAPTSTFYNGRGPNSGRVNAIAVNPRNSSIIYIGTARGGVWKTTNGGGSWVPLTDGQCALAINAVVLDPANPDIVYATTGDHGNGFSSSCGVLRSTDAGASWTPTGESVFGGVGRAGILVYDLVVDASTAGSANGTTLVAATSNGVYRSTTSGGSWAQLFNSPVLEQLVADPRDGMVIYGGTARQSTAAGVYRSVDGGVNWTRLATGLPAAPGRTKVAIAPSSPSTIYAASCGVGSAVGALLGVYRSTDAGASWTAVNTTLGSDFSDQCWYGLHLTVDPASADRVYLGGGVWLYRSTTGGASWSHIGDQQIHVDQHAFAVDPRAPGTVYAGNDGGIFRSLDKGTTWTSLGAGVGTTLFTRGIAINPVNPSQLLGGTQDHGTLETTGALVWTEAMGGDGGYGAYDAAGTTAFTEYVWGSASSSGPRRRDPTGGFVLRRIGIDLADRGAFYPPLVMDPARSRMLYFGTNRVYRTVNSGDLWAPISGDLSRGSGVVTAIAAALSDSAVVYAGTSDGQIQSTLDGGLTWRIGAGVPNRSVTSLRVDAGSALVAFATVSGYGTPHVLKTVDGGITWTAISGNLPDAPTNDIVVQGTGGEMNVATDVGLFRSADGGATWALFPGLPNVVIMSLAYHAPSRTLAAATYGRGMFLHNYTAATALRGDVDNDSQVTAADALGVLNAVIGRPLPATYRLFPQGDANCDGAMSVLDAQVILSHVVGLPGATGCAGTVR